MRQLRRIHKATHGLLALPADRGATTQGLPADLAAEASQRLGIACLVYAFTYFMAYFMSSFVAWTSDQSFSLWRHFFLRTESHIAWAAILLALGVFAIARFSRLKPERVLDIGLAFVIVGAAGISCNTLWGVLPDGPPDWRTGNRYMGVPWEGVWIILYPVIAPNKPTRILLAAVAAASTGLITTWVSRYIGATSPEVSYTYLLQYFLFTTYLCALLAWFSSIYIYRLGGHVRRAREIGSYQLVKKLGAGGMGEVWRARHRMLARPAAIKLIRSDVLGDDAGAQGAVLARFEREAQATASLQSPHTIRVYDFGATAEGSFYYVMELLHGIGLDELVHRFGPQSPERVVFILTQICHSLVDAHQNGMIHRDIKPGNIFVCRLGQEYDFVKVLDFGLVKSTSKSESFSMDLTRNDITCGTPGYLSPEMVLSRPEIDGRADLYSLGCVAYWLLTGTAVFSGDTALATAAMHLRDEPIPPSRRCEFTIPNDLEQTILACLAKEPADRPADAEQLADRLAACALEKRWQADAAQQWWETNKPLRDAGSSAGDAIAGDK